MFHFFILQLCVPYVCDVVNLGGVLLVIVLTTVLLVLLVVDCVCLLDWTCVESNRMNYSMHRSKKSPLAGVRRMKVTRLLWRSLPFLPLWWFQFICVH